MTATALERCDIRLSSEDKAFLQLAASLDGISLSAFIRKAAISAAKDTISKNDRYVLSGREVIYNRIQLLCRQSEQITDLIWKRTEIPDVCHRHHQLYMSHTFTAYFLFCNFYTTTVADDTFITDTLIFTAMAFVILNRTKNALAEQTIAFGFVRTVIYGFRLQNFTTRIL